LAEPVRLFSRPTWLLDLVTVGAIATGTRTSRRQEFERQEKGHEKARPQGPGFFIVEVSNRGRISAAPG
jgi:hypothetical protein